MAKDSACASTRMSPPDIETKSKLIVDNYPHDTQRPLILETFGRFVQLLKRQLSVSVKFLIIQQFADRALALIHFLQDFLQVCHRFGRLAVQGIILEQFAQSTLARVDLIDNASRIANRKLYLGSGILQFCD